MYNRSHSYHNGHNGNKFNVWDASTAFFTFCTSCLPGLDPDLVKNVLAASLEGVTLPVRLGMRVKDFSNIVVTGLY